LLFVYRYLLPLRDVFAIASLPDFFYFGFLFALMTTIKCSLLKLNPSGDLTTFKVARTVSSGESEEEKKKKPVNGKA